MTGDRFTFSQGNPPFYRVRSPRPKANVSLSFNFTGKAGPALLQDPINPAPFMDPASKALKKGSVPANTGR